MFCGLDARMHRCLLHGNDFFSGNSDRDTAAWGNVVQKWDSARTDIDIDNHIIVWDHRTDHDMRVIHG